MAVPAAECTEYPIWGDFTTVFLQETELAQKMADIVRAFGDFFDECSKSIRFNAICRFYMFVIS